MEETKESNIHSNLLGAPTRNRLTEQPVDNSETPSGASRVVAHDDLLTEAHALANPTF